MGGVSNKQLKKKQRSFETIACTLQLTSGWKCTTTSSKVAKDSDKTGCEMLWKQKRTPCNTSLVAVKKTATRFNCVCGVCCYFFYLCHKVPFPRATHIYIYIFIFLFIYLFIFWTTNEIKLGMCTLFLVLFRLTTNFFGTRAAINLVLCNYCLHVFCLFICLLVVIF